MKRLTEKQMYALVQQCTIDELIQEINKLILEKGYGWIKTITISSKNGDYTCCPLYE